MLPILSLSICWLICWTYHLLWGVIERHLRFCFWQCHTCCVIEKINFSKKNKVPKKLSFLTFLLSSFIILKFLVVCFETLANVFQIKLKIFLVFSKFFAHLNYKLRPLFSGQIGKKIFLFGFFMYNEWMKTEK